MNRTDLVIRYVLTHLDDLLNRGVLIELLTLPDRTEAQIVGKDEWRLPHDYHRIFVGKLVVHDGEFFRVDHYEDKGSYYQLEVTPTRIVDDGTVLLDPVATFELQSGMIANYTGEPVVTTVGRLMLNYLILAYPFGNLIPYQNDVWKSSKIEGLIAEALINKKIDAAQHHVYVNNMLFIGHSPELCAPNLTEKALTTDPKITARKKELLEEHNAALMAGDAVVMSQIESELIAMDKAYLKGDDSLRYMLKAKHFDIIRKKMFLIHGMVGSFGDQGQYNFVPNSLEEGWTQHAFPIIANEIRAGSYARAKETAKGGEESKFILRVFQGTRIVEDDCGSTDGLAVAVHSGNAAKYIFRNYLQADGTLSTVTSENYKDFIGKTVTFRSPMYCHTKNGNYCFTCMGKLFGSVRQSQVATVMNNVGAQMTTLSLKQSHGIAVKTATISSLNDFIV